MNIQQLYTKCLAQGAYYIESNGIAAVIDPLRDITEYLTLAEKNNAQIKYIFETHFHADFVSGHLELQKATGATIVYGPTAQTHFESHVAQDNETFSIGKLSIKTLHTPGHTLESTCWLLLDEQGNPNSLFSGDTLFIGDVGRPDLAQKSGSITMEDLASMLYDSLHSKIIPLPNEVVIYPAHGAGSACGKNMSSDTFDTLGNQKSTNYALKAASKEQFIKEVTEGLLPPPAYFPENVQLNKKGYDSLEKILEKGLEIIQPDRLKSLLLNNNNTLILDTRSPQTFKDGFLQGSINIGIKGDFAPWVGTLIHDIKTPLVLVTNPGEEKETITRLCRVGYENILGCILPNILDWKNAGLTVESITSISAEELAALFNEKEISIFDVRKQSEYNNGHIPGAHFASLQFIDQHLSSFSPDETHYVHCQGGYRSMIACSILQRKGIKNIIDIAGGYANIAKTIIPQEKTSCATA
jgi:hydroxyacylglutathione hydrolase